MKYFPRRWSVLVFAVVALFALAFSPPDASAQARWTALDLSATTYVTNVQTLAVTTTAIPVHAGGAKQCVVQPTFKLASTGTSNVVFGFQVSIDNGLTYSTTTPITVTAAANGTTSVVAPTIIGIPTQGTTTVTVTTTGSTSTNVSSVVTASTTGVLPTLYPVITHLKLASIQNYNGVNVTNISVKVREFN